MLTKIGQFKDPDGTEKYVFKNEHGVIEISRMVARDDRDVLCIPSMYGCALACKFCHLTTEKITGSNRRIPAEVILEAAAQLPSDNKRNFLFCVMGVGDPLLNLPLLRDLADLPRPEHIENHTGHIGTSIATIMPTKDGLAGLMDLNLPIKVHFSLHSPFDAIRKEMVPGSALSVEESLDWLCWYGIEVGPRYESFWREFYRVPTPVEIHYTLIEGMNDRDEDLAELERLLKKYPIPVKFIMFNPTGDLKRSPREVQFVEALRAAVNVPMKLHLPPGRDIGSSCGEFTKHFYHETLSPTDQVLFDEYKRKYSF